MPLTVGHYKSVTIADGTNADIVRPSDWNSAHSVIFSPAGSELIGGFTNGMVSFGTNTDGYITASHGAQYKTDADALYFPKINEGQTVTPNGFPDRSQVAYSWSNSTRTLTLTPTGSSFTVWSNGIRYTKSSAVDFVFSDVEGRHYAYFDDSGNPQTTTTFSTNLILRWAITGILYWDATNKVAVPDIQVEWHGTDWPPELHLQQHLTVGCTYQSGLDLTLTPDQDGSALSHISVAGASGYIWDEDIQHSIAARLASATLPVLYKSGATPNWRVDATSQSLVRAGGSGRAVWNQDNAGTWQQTEMTDGYFAVVYVCTGSGLATQWFAVMGSAEYASLDEATTAAKAAPDLSGLPFQEYRMVGAVVIETNNSFTNAVKSRVRYMTDGEAWVDWRNEKTVASTVSTGSSLQIVADGVTYANGQVEFGNSGPFSFVTSNGSIVGSYNTSALMATSQSSLLQHTSATSAITSNAFPTANSTNLLGTGYTTHTHAGYLTTARASNDAIGLNTAITQNGVSMTANSSGLSLNFPAFLTTAMQSNASTGYMLTGERGNYFYTSNNTFANQTHSHGNPTLALTNLSGTTASASNGFTLSLSAVAGGGGADGYNIIGVNGNSVGSAATIQFSNSNNVTFGLNGSTVTASASYPAQTVQPAVGQLNGSSGTMSFAVGSSLSASSNASTITFGLASNITTALQSAGAYLTTAAQVSHSHGNPTLALTNLNGTTASASNGVTFSLSAPAQTNQTANFYANGNTTQLSSTAGIDLRSVSFEGAGIASVGVSNGRVLVSVPSGGGAGDGYNILAAGGSTAGTAATIQFDNANGVSFGLNGSTITASVNAGGGAAVTFSGYRPYDDREHIAGQVGQGTIVFDPDVIQNVQFDRICIPINCTNSSNSSGSHTISYWLGIYSKNANTLSLWGSTSTSVALTHSGTAGSYSLYSGMRLMTIPWTTTLPEGNYWFANLSRTTSGGANGSYSQFVLSQLASNFLGHFGSSHNTTMQYVLGQGVYSATSSGLPNSVAFSQINGSGSAYFRAPKFYFASGTA